MKTDHKREIASYSARRGELSLVDVPSLHYLAIDGHGDPNTAQAYADAIATVYPVAYKLKFLSKTELDRDYTVMPLEALWWSDDMSSFTDARDKTQWSWTLLNLVPDWLTAEHVEVAQSRVEAAGGGPSLAALRLVRLDEGLCVQTLHVGSYDDEAPTLARLHDEFIPKNDLRMTGHHHEVYLSDPRRTAPDKLRTILRQPVERAT
ncbi:MAG TPA: GyrI-like domain-containing protein [Plantibacter sp.]|uniref:GyrI-like domain-containing protein n=1 Tax=unclassified Plantibacter TaxID=2624265 RepID=UPI002B5CBBD5|nr:GyrI-like domain-containing protein [Plantibacter sp.]